MVACDHPFPHRAKACAKSEVNECHELVCASPRVYDSHEYCEHGMLFSDSRTDVIHTYHVFYIPHVWKLGVTV